jgi:hypothetical protein
MENSNNEIEQFGPYKKKPEGKTKKLFVTIGATFITIILYASVAYFEFGGIYHAWKKHNDAVLAFFIPPLAWYRAVEVFWHDDFAGVNWEQRLKDDAHSCIFILNSFIRNSTIPTEMNRDIEKLSIEILKYPDDKLNVLKKVSRLYIEYSLIAVEDAVRATKDYIRYGQTNLSYSGKIVEVENKLKAFLPIDSFQELVHTTKTSYEAVTQKLNEAGALTEEQQGKVTENLAYFKQSAKTKVSEAYKKLFNEDL